MTHSTPKRTPGNWQIVTPPRCSESTGRRPRRPIPDWCAEGRAPYYPVFHPARHTESRSTLPRRKGCFLRLRRIGSICLIMLLGVPGLAADLVAPDAALQQVGQGFQFTEGPAADAAGHVFFTDVRTSRIHKWSADDNTIAVFRADTGNANGLAFGPDGSLFICEGGNGRVTVLDPHGDLEVLADGYQGRRFNQPNDLWVDPKGGVYFSDPIYGRGNRVQDGEHVYYVSPDRKRVIRVINDMQRPNGLIGTSDGRTLYVTDHGGGKTFRYAIKSDGTLADKTLFCEVGSDGMTLDSCGNVYLTSDAVLVFDPKGRQVQRIAVPERPTNVTFAGPDRKTLFITARTTVYALAMAVSGVSRNSAAASSLASDASDSSDRSDSRLTELAPDGTVRIPGGTFQMGDHHDLGGREHRNDEVPIHEVTLDPFFIGRHEVTNAEYCRFLNAALVDEALTVRAGNVFARPGGPLLCETRPTVPHSHIEWSGTAFAPATGKERHPVVCIRWEGAAAYCNWLSIENGIEPCYDLRTWACDYAGSGYRLPTEAEWEYAGRGGLHTPYRIYPWGDDADVARANWPNSGDPYETGPLPLTTPVGFYNGELRTKADFGWPGRQETYQTKNGSNGYGLYDMAGNVWEWCNDWYTNTYYAAGPAVNPQGPASGKPMPDGKPYRVLRSGNWYNGPEGHSRVSNRNPAHFRGPQDPNHPYYHIGFRIVRDVAEDGPRREAGEPGIISAGSAGDGGGRRTSPGANPDRPQRNNPWGAWRRKP